MIKGIRGDELNKFELNSSSYILKKNKPRIINKDCNCCVGVIIEESNSEKLYVSAVFSDESFGLICNEYKLNFWENSKATDLSFYYFSGDYRMITYSYDMKESLAGENTIIKLIEQWRMGIASSRTCSIQLWGNGQPYNLRIEDIHIGVITENNDVERRERELEKLINNNEIPSGLSSAMISKRRAEISTNIEKIKLLKAFNAGYIYDDEYKYKYVFDIRLFEGKEHNMIFRDGILV